MKAIKTFLLILGLFAVCGGVQAAITGSNLMLADNTNTVRTSDDLSNWYSTSNPPPSSQWFDRSVGTPSAGFVLGVDPVLGAINVSYSANASYGPEIRSTISGLNVGMRYHVWALTSLTPASNNRALAAGFDDGSGLTSYSLDNSTDTGLITHSTDWNLFEGYLGVATVDGSGDIEVLVGWADGAERSVYHGLAYVTALDAWNPTPADGTVRLFPETDPALQWNAGQDPANPGSANPAIAEHVVYMGIYSEPNDTPILTEATRVAVNGGTAEWNPTGQWEIERDMFVYWSIGEATVQGSTDPNDVIAGPVWFFSTASAYAEIDPATPADSRVALGDTTSFTVSATNPFTDPAESTGLSYQWYKGSSMNDPAKVLLTEDAKYSGVATTTLTVSNVVSGDESNYFCLVTVDSNGNAKASKAGYMTIKRLVGHWKLDGNANDELGNNGIEIGTVSYQAGMVDDCLFLDNIDQDNEDVAPVPINHIEIAHIDAYREDAFTVSCWVKSVTPGFKDEHNYGGAVSKTDSTGDGPGWSMRKDALGYEARWFTYGSTSLVSEDATYFMHGGDWHHLVGVYDEENNFKGLYTDGVLDTSIDDLGTDIDLLVADGKLYIGMDYAGRTPGEILIDDVQLYNYALDKFEIGHIYADGAGVPVCVEYPVMDIDTDCDVDLDDLKLFVANWLECGIVPDCIGL